MKTQAEQWLDKQLSILTSMGKTETQAIEQLERMIAIMRGIHAQRLKAIHKRLHSANSVIVLKNCTDFLTTGKT